MHQYLVTIKGIDDMSVYRHHEYFSKIKEKLLNFTELIFVVGMLEKTFGDGLTIQTTPPFFRPPNPRNFVSLQKCSKSTFNNTNNDVRIWVVFSSHSASSKHSRMPKARESFCGGGEFAHV